MPEVSIRAICQQSPIKSSGFPAVGAPARAQRRLTANVVVPQEKHRAHAGRRAQHAGLKKTLGALDLTFLGIGAIIGTGIFVLTGTGAVQAGPALMMSFIVAAIACGFAALAYAEFASTIPVAGSIYTYSYATLGELAAWIIGWDLMLEYGLATSAVSVGWSGYLQSLLSGFGISLPIGADRRARRAARPRDVLQPARVPRDDGDHRAAVGRRARNRRA